MDEHKQAAEGSSRSPGSADHADGLAAEAHLARRVAGTIWLTGLPASGKTTLAVALHDRLRREGETAQVLDGDLLRGGINADLGFSRDDRLENVRRVSEVARLFGKAGFVVVAAVVSPHEEGRARARRAHTAAGLWFLEVWVATSLGECERRDPKGLYARGRRGEISGVTGLDDPYEPPSSPELVVRPGQQTVEECVEAVLRELGHVRRSAAPAAASAPAGPLTDCSYGTTSDSPASVGTGAPVLGVSTATSAPPFGQPASPSGAR